MAYIYEELSASQIACRLREGAGFALKTDAGAMALAEYLQDCARETGEPWEMDAVALRCDFNEYANLEDFQKDYGAEKYESIEDIESDTRVILIDGTDGFIIQVF
jgi:hypothetical protein